MQARRTDATAPPRAPKSAAIRPVAIPADRRLLIDAQVAQLSATARRIAAELRFSADASDFVRVLDEAGRS